MESILLPSKIEYQKGATPNETILIAEPCFQGYGTTLGNALRRVLFSSLPGAAVTAVKIKGVQHEFSAIQHIKEDVLEIILNLKLLRLKVFAGEPVRLKLQIRGEKKVTAKDIEPDANVEIINPNLHIATLTDKNAELDMEIFVSRGRGYSPTEERSKEGLEIGTILIDAAFGPVINVAVKVENVRVGQITNYDKLLLTVETDGTMTPKEAIEQAVTILIEHLNLLKSPSEEGKTKKSAKIEKGEKEETAAEEQPRLELEKEEEKAGAAPAKKRGRPRKTK